MTHIDSTMLKFSVVQHSFWKTIDHRPFVQFPSSSGTASNSSALSATTIHPDDWVYGFRCKSKSGKVLTALVRIPVEYPLRLPQCHLYLETPTAVSTSSSSSTTTTQQQPSGNSPFSQFIDPDLAAAVEKSVASPQIDPLLPHLERLCNLAALSHVHPSLRKQPLGSLTHPKTLLAEELIRLELQGTYCLNQMVRAILIGFDLYDSQRPLETLPQYL